jgi:RNA polymerase sigma-70 factor (ECF subfamily)
MDIYRRYGPALLRKAERMLQSRDEAQDLVQGLFVDLLARDETAGETAVDLPYLYRAITNRCLNYLRDRRNHGRLPAQHAPELCGEPRTRIEDRVVDRQVLARLAGQVDAQAWEVLVYHAVDDMTQDEIAALLGISRKTVVRKLGALRAKIRALAVRASESPS